MTTHCPPSHWIQWVFRIEPPQNGIFMDFFHVSYKSIGGWMNISSLTPLFWHSKFQVFFHFPGGQLAQRWRGHFWRVGEKTERQVLLEKMQLKLETIHDTLKKLDLLFKLQMTINFPNSWIGWKFAMDTLDRNQPWFKHRRPNACSWITFSSKASPPKGIGNQLEGHRLMEIKITAPHNHLHPY